MTKTLRLILAAVTMLYGVPVGAELRQEMDVSVQQRYQRTVNGAPSAVPTEYGEIPNGLILERYGMSLDTDKYLLDAEITNLGLNNQSIKLEGGQPGKMTWALGWDKMPHLFSNEARSPFAHQGDGVMKLNGGWRNTDLTKNNSAFNAGVSTALAGTPYVPLDFEVNTGNLDLRFHPAHDFTIELGGWRQTKVGTRAQPASFGFSNAIELAAPINWETNETYLDMQWAKKAYQLAFSYRLSDFNNKIPRLSWDNPKRLTENYTASNQYSSGDSSANGALANAPSNQTHAFKLEGGAALPMNGRFSFEGGYQHWLASNPMLEYTTNRQMIQTNAVAAAAGLTFPAFDPTYLPNQNVEGKMNIFTYLGKLTMRPLPWLRGSLMHDAYIMENLSTRNTVPGWAVFDQVWHSETVTTPREQFREDKTSLKLDYDITSWMSGDLGLTHKYEKVTREIDKRREDSVTTGLTFRPLHSMFVNLSYLLSLRRGNGMDLQHYPTTVSQYTGRTYYTEAPGLRRIDAADRNRNQVRAQAQWAFGDTSVALSARLTEDKYRLGKGDSTGADPLVYAGQFGVTSDMSRAVGLDFSIPLLENLTADAYYEYDHARRYLRSSQTACAGSPSGSTVNVFSLPGEPACSSANSVVSVMLQDPRTVWENRITEQSNIAGLSLTWRPIAKVKTSVGYDITDTRSNHDPVYAGRYASTSTDPYNSFPTSRRMQQTARARGEYAFNDAFTVGGAYQYDKFDATDFAYGNLQLRDLSNASIFLGANPIRNFYAHLVSMQMKYRF